MSLTHIAHLEIIGQELAIVWNDQTESYISLDNLRKNCPCARCAGEPDALGEIIRPQVTYTDQSFQLQSYTFVGGYALQPTWGDGHNTGIYSFSLLKTLGA